jgi:hypothetical protein
MKRVWLGLANLDFAIMLRKIGQVSNLFHDGTRAVLRTNAPYIEAFALPRRSF